MDKLDTIAQGFFLLAEEAARNGGFRVSMDGKTAILIAGEISNQTRFPISEVMKKLDEAGKKVTKSKDWLKWLREIQPEDVRTNARFKARDIARAACIVFMKGD
jgi:hypothetical protein